MSRAMRLALASVVLVVASCNNDDDEAKPPTSTTAPSSTTTAETTTTTGARPCGSVSVPSGASARTTAVGDVDGDGEDDELRSYLLGNDEAHLQVSLAAGGGADLVVTTFGTPALAVLGGADVDGDGADEVWAQTGFGASATIVGLARLAGCELVSVTFAGGDPVELAVGGSVGSAAGIACDAHLDPTADLTTYSASNMDSEGGGYDITATEYALEGTSLVQKAIEATTASAGDDMFTRATGFSCDGLSL
jgi:hypothetical protein